MARLRNLKKLIPVSVVVRRDMSRILAEVSQLLICERGNRLTFIASERGSIRQYAEKSDESNGHSRARTEDDCLNVPSASPKTKVLMKSLFFGHFATKKSDRTRKLSLNGNKVFLRRGKRLGDSDVPDLLIFLRDNSEIVELDLACNEIHCDGFIDIINHIATHEEIVKLDLRNNEIRSKGIKHLCESGGKLRLKTLGLNGNKYGVESSKQIALMLLNNRWLRELNVAEVDQTASSLVYFTTVLRNDQDLYNDTLKILNIGSPNPGCMYYFDSAHFSSIVGSMLKNNSCLEELHLQKFGFSCHDIELMLTEGRFNKTLSLLDLSGNNVGDFGVELLANWLTERPALSGLVVAHNIVTSTGARALSHGLPFSRIKHLDLSYNRIDDSGITNILNTIKKSPCIRQFRVFGNSIGHNAAKIIDRMLLSGVLIQENLDVKPYKVDNEWCCARYSTDKNY